MQTNALSRFLLVLFSMITVLLLVYTSQVNNISALSPSFFRIVIPDQSPSGNMDTEPFLKDKFGSLLPIDILSTSFFSDGRTLNGTIWLRNPINDIKHSDYVNSNLTFVMRIRGEVFPSWVYQVIIYPEIDGTWTQVLNEYEPYTTDEQQQVTKPLKIDYNHTGFFHHGERYIDLSLDLREIGLPDRYRVGFATGANKDGFVLEDWVYVQNVPPRVNIINFNWPENFVVKAGEDLRQKISVNSTELLAKQTIRPEDENKTDGIQVSFIPNVFKIPMDGITNVDLLVTTSEAVAVRNYSLPIRVNTFSEEGTYGNLSQAFTVQIAPPLSPMEKFSNSLSYYSFYLSFIPLIVTSIIALALSRIINTKTSVFSNLSITDIITIDASVIVGVLFFLTLEGAELASGEDRLYIGILTASIVYPFAISAVRVVVKGSPEYGMRFMIAGFVYLMIAIALIAFLRN
jgi:hypothetical protein